MVGQPGGPAEPAGEQQLLSIPGRRNVLDLFEDQRGGHCGPEGMRAEEAGGSAGQGKTVRLTF